MPYQEVDRLARALEREILAEMMGKSHESLRYDSYASALVHVRQAIVHLSTVGRLDQAKRPPDAM